MVSQLAFLRDAHGLIVTQPTPTLGFKGQTGDKLTRSDSAVCFNIPSLHCSEDQGEWKKQLT